MLLDCKEFVLLQQKSGRFVFLSRRTRYLVYLIPYLMIPYDDSDRKIQLVPP